MAIKKKNITPTEKQIIQLVAEGLTDLEIAAKMAYSYNTVRLYINNACLKLDAANRTNLVHVSHQKGVLK